MGHYYLDNPPRPFYEVEYTDKKRAGENPAALVHQKVKKPRVFRLPAVLKFLY